MRSVWLYHANKRVAIGAASVEGWVRRNVVFAARSHSSLARLIQHYRDTEVPSRDVADALDPASTPCRKEDAHTLGADPDLLARQTLRWIKDEAQVRYGSVQRSDSQQGLDLDTNIACMVSRLVDDHEPIAYILGNQPFGPLTIACRPPTLIPRPETEFMTEHLAQLLCKDAAAASCGEDRFPRSCTRRKPLKILDLCTGTGCIALLLRHRLLACMSEHGETMGRGETIDSEREDPLAVSRQRLSITGADISETALSLARENAQSTTIENGNECDSSVHFCQVDIFDDISVSALTKSGSGAIRGPCEPFDIVVCNPPYITAGQWTSLDRNVRDWEDRMALVGDGQGDDKRNDDGLLFYRRLAVLVRRGELIAGRSGRAQGSRSGQHDFRAAPSLAVEVGMGQAIKVADLFRRAAPAQSRIEIWRDPFGVERGVFLWLS